MFSKTKKEIYSVNDSLNEVCDKYLSYLLELFMKELEAEIQNDGLLALHNKATRIPDRCRTPNLTNGSIGLEHNRDELRKFIRNSVRVVLQRYIENQETLGTLNTIFNRFKNVVNFNNLLNNMTKAQKLKAACRNFNEKQLNDYFVKHLSSCDSDFVKAVKTSGLRAISTANFASPRDTIQFNDSEDPEEIYLYIKEVISKGIYVYKKVSNTKEGFLTVLKDLIDSKKLNEQAKQNLANYLLNTNKINFLAKESNFLRSNTYSYQTRSMHEAMRLLLSPEQIKTVKVESKNKSVKELFTRHAKIFKTL